MPAHPTGLYMEASIRQKNEPAHKPFGLYHCNRGSHVRTSSRHT